MPDGVDAAVQRMQALSLDAVVDGIEGEPECDQLAPCDHAVLAARKLGDHLVGATRAILTVYDRQNFARVSHVVHRRPRGYARPHGRCRP